MNLKVRLAFMNFLQFAVWGAYLTCMGIYLANAGMSTHIGAFFAMQGIVSIFMPALMGIVADRWIPAQRLLGLCHLLAGAFMMGAAAYGYYAGSNVTFATLFTLYSVSVAFYMPTLALSNSVAYCALTQAGMDTVKDFPPIRVFGTVGFICSMWFVDIMDHPERYKGKKVHMKMQMSRSGKYKGTFTPGRLAMVCCEADIAFYGMMAKGDLGNYRDGEWIEVTAEAGIAKHPAFEGGEGPFLKIESVTRCKRPVQEVVTF